MIVAAQINNEHVATARVGDDKHGRSRHLHSRTLRQALLQLRYKTDRDAWPALVSAQHIYRLCRLDVSALRNSTTIMVSINNCSE